MTRLEDILNDADGNIRVTSEGKLSIADVMKFAMSDVSPSHRCNTYRKVQKQFNLEVADRATFEGPGRPTMVVSPAEIERLLKLLPPKERVVKKPERGDSLYIMRRSNDATAVKIGRSRNVEGRRAALEAGQNFFVEVLVVFPSKGYLETQVHMQLNQLRSTTGSSREWFNIPVNEAVEVVARALQAVEARPNGQG